MLWVWLRIISARWKDLFSVRVTEKLLVEVSFAWPGTKCKLSKKGVTNI